MEGIVPISSFNSESELSQVILIMQTFFKVWADVTAPHRGEIVRQVSIEKLQVFGF